MMIAGTFFEERFDVPLRFWDGTVRSPVYLVRRAELCSVGGAAMTETICPVPDRIDQQQLAQQLNQRRPGRRG